MRVRTVADAWREANKIIPSDYMKNEELSRRAGYPTYYSTSDVNPDDHINDLNCRLEVVVGGEHTNIWIEEIEELDKQKRSELHKDIRDMIVGHITGWDNALESRLEVLDGIDHTDPNSSIILGNIVGSIKEARAQKDRFVEMLERFDEEVEKYGRI